MKDTYEYIDSSFEVLHVTQVPLSDQDALNRFSEVAQYGPTYDPIMLRVKRIDGTEEVLPWRYDKATDELTPTGG